MKLMEKRKGYLVSDGIVSFDPDHFTESIRNYDGVLVLALNMRRAEVDVSDCISNEFVRKFCDLGFKVEDVTGEIIRK